MQKKNISAFYRKALLFLLPFYLLAGLYTYSDPFKVFRKYKTYTNKPVLLNPNYVGWQTFLNNKDSLQYDSFILGNSCTMAFPTSLWENYLDDCTPVRLFGNNETLCAINMKVKRLDEIGSSIKNVLLVLDYGTLKSTRVSQSHGGIPHPDVTGESYMAFQLKFISAFLNPKILIPIVDYSLFQTYKPYMEGVINDKETFRNQLTNDALNPRELEITEKQEQYWEEHRKEFIIRKPKDTYAPIVNCRQRQLLEEIKSVFDKHDTNFRVILSPEWNKTKLASCDVSALQEIFGSENVFDYSGKNEFTEDHHNFYEKGHYRPVLGEKILNLIYQ